MYFIAYKILILNGMTALCGRKTMALLLTTNAGAWLVLYLQEEHYLPRNTQAAGGRPHHGKCSF
jgi:hypothetical protein